MIGLHNCWKEKRSSKFGFCTTVKKGFKIFCDYLLFPYFMTNLIFAKQIVFKSTVLVRNRKTIIQPIELKKHQTMEQKMSNVMLETKILNLKTFEIDNFEYTFH